MKRWWICFAGILAALLLDGLPFIGTDVAKLQPVEVLYLAKAGDTVTLTADTGDTGRGATAEAALQDMQAHCPGTIFLDTASYLLVEEQALEALEEMNSILRPSCRVCLAVGTPELEGVAAYLEAHNPSVTIQDCKSGAELPALYTREGRILLVQP